MRETKRYTYYFADGTRSTVEVSPELFDILEDYDAIDYQQKVKRKYGLVVELTDSILQTQSEGETGHRPSFLSELAEFSAALDKAELSITPDEIYCANAYLRAGSFRKAAELTCYRSSTVNNKFNSLIDKLKKIK